VRRLGNPNDRCAVRFMKAMVEGKRRAILDDVVLGVGADEVVHASLDATYAGAPISASAVPSSLFPGPRFCESGSAVEADGSARSQQVHLPTRDHNWRERRVGLLDVLATRGRGVV
jgi:hypothetical protein